MFLEVRLRQNTQADHHFARQAIGFASAYFRPPLMTFRRDLRLAPPFAQHSVWANRQAKIRILTFRIHYAFDGAAQFSFIVPAVLGIANSGDSHL